MPVYSDGTATVTEPLEPVRPVVVPVTHEGVVPRAVPTRNGWEALMPAALKTYVLPASSVLGRDGL